MGGNTFAEQKKQLLQQKQEIEALLAKVTHQDDTFDEGFVPPPTHGQDDEAERVVDLEMGVKTRGSLRVTLHEIDEALQRIEEGIYGTCAACGEEIPEARLAISPASRYCIECQRKHDWNE
ncbi:MAG TPA: TraR/DksA family transcriptional regulator [bacterium]|nr:TraR/DksA family transcriptional regulator [bacterium]